MSQIREKEMALRRSKRLEVYLKDFYTYPSLRPEEISKIFSLVGWEINEEKETEGRVITLHLPEAMVAPVGQAFIMSYGRRVLWESVSSHIITEFYFDNTPLMEQLMQPDLLVLTHIAHQHKHEMTKELIQQLMIGRALKGKDTLILIVGSGSVMEFWRFMKPINYVPAPKLLALYEKKKFDGGEC